jgi:hypothetical protein
VIELDCSQDATDCVFVGLVCVLGVVTLVSILIGAAIGVRAHASSLRGSCKGFERLVLMTSATILGWHWMIGRGNPWWFVFGLPLLLTLCFFAITLPFGLSMAVISTVRGGVDIWSRTRRLVLVIGLVPLLYLLVFRSGLWPSRVSERAMTANFVKHRGAFETIQAFWHIGFFGGEYRKEYIYTTHPPSPLVDDLDASPVREPGALAFYEHLTGSWYLMYASN